ncbi:PREDICTED: probable LRR receptor-like serine/threonine-protein kinase At5g10290, partial [Tarenaya hassleriana]|uniref:probable LRR receptor-like serine/threonine-protein kinase At5g10290 n=1 Tax=Tarenaya hassleriana TaxID=28532 RepID=UPI00053CA845
MALALAALVFACLWSFVLPDAQGDALFALRNSLRATPDQLGDWNQNQVNPCTWSQVICDDNNSVTSVTLSYMNFSGTLSPRIGILNTLKTLTLKGNGITGGIPEEFGDLSSLNSLDLEDNRLTGPIPSTLGNLKNLQFLTLSRNSLNGSVPESLTRLSNLINLLLDSNNFRGQIPESLFEIPKYNFSGNSLNCGNPNPHPCVSEDKGSGGSNKPKTGIIAGVVSAV